MKKKCSLIACILAILLLFTGCQSKAEEVTYDQESMEQVAEFLITNFTQFSDEQFDALLTSPEFTLEYTLMNTGLQMDSDVFKSAIESWQASVEECGAYIDHGDYTLETKTSGAVLRTEAEYADRTAELEFTFDEDSRLETLTVNAKYSTGEILKKAGLNTILGMGTVFLVLIFMAFVISLIKYIPAVLEKMQKKPAQKASPMQEAPVTKAIASVQEEEDLTDDLELAAVIAAAIAASEGTAADGFVVRSIKKRRMKNHW